MVICCSVSPKSLQRLVAIRRLVIQSHKLGGCVACLKIPHRGCRKGHCHGLIADVLVGVQPLPEALNFDSARWRKPSVQNGRKTDSGKSLKKRERAESYQCCKQRLEKPQHGPTDALQRQRGASVLSH